jgi:hypothetical protein
LQVSLLHRLGGFEFHVDDVEAGGCGFAENLYFSGDVASELASIRSTATGGDTGGSRIVGEEVLDLRQGQEGLLKIVEAELDEGRLFDGSTGFFEHLGSGGTGDGYADFADAGTEKLLGYAGHIRSLVYNRGILQTSRDGCKIFVVIKGFYEDLAHGPDCDI